MVSKKIIQKMKKIIENFDDVEKKVTKIIEYFDGVETNHLKNDKNYRKFRLCRKKSSKK